MSQMTPRERVLAALSHREVDRVPVDLGGTQNSTMCTLAYENLKAYLDVQAPTMELGKAFEIVRMDEETLRRLSIDTRGIFARPPARSRVRWLDDRTYVDDWGITYRQPENWPQFDMIAHPLAEATIADLYRFDWPDVTDAGRYAGLREEARAWKEDSPFAVTGSTMDTTIFDRSWMLRGMEQFLMDMVADPAFATALMEKVTELQIRRHVCFLEQVGPYMDAIMLSDDLGVQAGPLISPALYRRMIKPLHRRYIQAVKEHTDAKIIMHACGSVADLIEDYIEIGVDALNPMQVSAVGMAPTALQARFGGRMAFWGGIDSQWLLPKGTPAQVRQAVRDLLGTMGLQGGLVLGAVHNVQDDVPPENVWALFDEAVAFHG